MLVIFGPLLSKYTNHPFIPKNAAVSSDVGIFPRNSAASLPQLLVVLNMISVKKNRAFTQPELRIRPSSGGSGKTENQCTRFRR